MCVNCLDGRFLHTPCFRSLRSPTLRGLLWRCWVSTSAACPNAQADFRVCPAYSITIYTLHSWMKDRPRFKLLLVTRYHNLFLSMWSLFMCVGASYTLIRAMMDGYTFSDLVCDNKDGNSRGALMKALGFWAYHYYISKVRSWLHDATTQRMLDVGFHAPCVVCTVQFYELLDTVLLVLKKKPLTTLHVYHHIMMVSTTWMWCHNGLTMHWFAIVVNCELRCRLDRARVICVPP